MMTKTVTASDFFCCH